MQPVGMTPNLIRVLASTSPELLAKMFTTGKLLEAEVLSVFQNRAMLSFGNGVRLEAALQAMLQEGQRVRLQVQAREQGGGLVLKLVQQEPGMARPSTPGQPAGAGPLPDQRAGTTQAEPSPGESAGTARPAPAGSAPTGPVRAESGSAGPPPTGSAPTGSAPTGSAPTGSAPTGSAPTGSAPTGSAPTGSAPTGSAPTGSTPTGSAPGGSAPTGSAPTGSAPTGSAPGGSAPGGSAPTGSAPMGPTSQVPVETGGGTAAPGSAAPPQGAAAPSPNLPAGSLGGGTPVVPYGGDASTGAASPGSEEPAARLVRPPETSGQASPPQAEGAVRGEPHGGTALAQSRNGAGGQPTGDGSVRAGAGSSAQAGGGAASTQSTGAAPSQTDSAIPGRTAVVAARGETDGAAARAGVEPGAGPSQAESALAQSRPVGGAPAGRAEPLQPPVQPAPTQVPTEAGQPPLIWIPIPLENGRQGWAQLQVQEGDPRTRAAGGAAHQIRLWWETPSLGQVQVTLDAAEQSLTALFTVLLASIRQSVEEGLSGLQSRLTAAGFPEVRLGCRQALPSEAIGPVSPGEGGSRLDRRL